MVLLDTDTVTLLFQGHARVENRMRSEEEDVAMTIITRIEILQGRFDAILKAADAKELQQAHQRLETSENQLRTLPIVPIDAPAAAQFQKLLGNKKLKRIGRGDLLIASIALAQKARLATRNLRDFRKVPGLNARTGPTERSFPAVMRSRQMDAYDPLQAPDAERWLALDEGERIALIEAYHRRQKIKAPNLHLHATMHANVENQLAMPDVPVVRATLARLLAEGLDRHDAVHAIASVLSAHMWKIMQPNAKPPKGDPNEAYYRELEKLTAAKWRASG